MIILFQDINIHFSVESKGTPLILLHGFMEDSSVWGNFRKTLNSFCKTVAIDLPGHGKTGFFSKTHTMEMMAQVVAKVLDYLNIEKAFILGHSMGGYVSLAFAENYSFMIEGLILLNSNSWEDSSEKKQNRERSMEVIKLKKTHFIADTIPNLFTKPKQFKKNVQAIISVANAMSEEGIIAAIKGMLIRKDRTNILEQLSKKLILTGIQDPLVYYKDIENIAQKTNTNLIYTKGAHMSFLEDEKSTAKAIEHFLII